MAENLGSQSFDSLYVELIERINSGDPESRTVELINLGTHSIGKKIVEEAAEVWMAAEYQSKHELAEEISQLLYHVQVLMHAHGLTPSDVYKFL
jgi:phosphoribosyl-ATP pyrophosphohydrolase